MCRRHPIQFPLFKYQRVLLLATNALLSFVCNKHCLLKGRPQNCAAFPFPTKLKGIKHAAVLRPLALSYRKVHRKGSQNHLRLHKSNITHKCWRGICLFVFYKIFRLVCWSSGVYKCASYRGKNNRTHMQLMGTFTTKRR